MAISLQQISDDITTVEIEHTLPTFLEPSRPCVTQVRYVIPGVFDPLVVTVSKESGVFTLPRVVAEVLAQHDAVHGFSTPVEPFAPVNVVIGAGGRETWTLRAPGQHDTTVTLDFGQTDGRLTVVTATYGETTWKKKALYRSGSCFSPTWPRDVEAVVEHAANERGRKAPVLWADID